MLNIKFYIRFFLKWKYTLKIYTCEEKYVCLYIEDYPIQFFNDLTRNVIKRKSYRNKTIYLSDANDISVGDIINLILQYRHS